MGLAGSLVSHFCHGPAILTSLIAAAGVSSLVYGFLGGIKGARFQWGNWKLQGSIAAFMVVTCITNYYLRQEYKLDIANQKYEWQWAGENWVGHLNTGRDGTASIDISKWHKECGGVLLEPPPFLVSDDSGSNGSNSVKESLDGTELNVNLKVKNTGDVRCPDDEIRTIKGKLTRTQAWAGRVEYTYQNRTSTKGDMILVNYQSNR